MSKGEHSPPERYSTGQPECSVYYFLSQCIQNDWLDLSGDRPWFDQAEIGRLWQQLNLPLSNNRPYLNLILPPPETILRQARSTYPDGAQLLTQLIGINPKVVANILLNNPPDQISLEMGLPFAVNSTRAYALGEIYIKKYLYRLQQIFSHSPHPTKRPIDHNILLNILLTVTAAHELAHKVDSFLELNGVSTMELASQRGWLDYSRQYLPDRPANRRRTFHREHLARGVEVMALAHLFTSQLLPEAPATKLAQRVFAHQHQKGRAAENLVDTLQKQGWNLLKIDYVLNELIRLVDNITNYQVDDSPDLMGAFAYGHPPYNREQLTYLLEDKQHTR